MRQHPLFPLRPCLLSFAAACAAGSAAQVQLATASSTGAVFIENRGQWDAQAQFLARSPGVDVWVTERGAVYDFYQARIQGLGSGGRGVDPISNQQSPVFNRKGHVVRMEFVGSGGSQVVGFSEREGKHNYFLGNDSSRWATDVPLFGEARSERVYPGVEARWYFDGGRPRYDLLVAPGTDPTQIKVRFEGVGALRTDGKALRLQTSLGEIQHNGLFAYQKVGGSTRQVACSFRVQGTTATFSVGSYDRSQPLVIDPIIWSTFLGGESQDSVIDVAATPSGDLVLVGGTSSSAFPVTVGAYDTSANGSNDVFVTKMNSTATALIYSTFMGGAVSDSAGAVALDSTGAAYLTGSTSSPNFPLMSAADGGFNGASDAFVAKFSGAGGLVWSTFWGGTGFDNGFGIAVDSFGDATVVGRVEAEAVQTFQTTFGAFDTTQNGGVDGFVSKFSSNGTVLWNSYLGGSGGDVANSVALNASGWAVVVGRTTSPDFPTVFGSYDTSYEGNGDAFVTLIQPFGNALVFSTFLGGLISEGAFSVGLDGAGNPVVSGSTNSVDFPLVGPLDATLGGSQDAFVAKLSSGGGSLLFSTLLGGSGSETAFGVAVDSAGFVTVAGDTSSADFPTTSGTAQASLGGGSDAFLAKLPPAGNALLYGSYVGGVNDDFGNSLANTGLGDPVVVGGTSSANFPITAGTFDSGLVLSEGFATKFRLGAPQAVDNSYGVVAQTTLTVAAAGVLKNDLGSPTSAVLVSGPTNASSFVLNSDGSFSYTPGSSFSGWDQFTYKASNIFGSGNTTTVDLNVRNTLSSLAFDAAVFPGSQPISGDVNLTVPAKAGGQVVYFFDDQPAVKSAGYSVTVAQGATSASFSLPTEVVGTTTTCTIRVSLRQNGTDSISNTVDLSPRPSVAPNWYQANANTLLQVAGWGVLGNDSVGAGAFSVVLGTSPSYATSFTLYQDGGFDYMPNTDFLGEDVFTYSVATAAGQSRQVQVRITVRNVVSAIAFDSLTVTGGNAVTGTVNVEATAPLGGTTVYFRDTSAAIQAEGYSVVVPAGQKSVAFSVPTTSVGSPVGGRLEAGTMGGTGIWKGARVHITP